MRVVHPRTQVPSLLGAIAIAIAFSSVAQAGVLPVGSHPYGKSYAEWGDTWWNWALHEPTATNPILDPDGSVGHLNQSAPVWFLAGNFGGATTRTLSMPHMPIFFPILNSVFWVPEDGATEAAVRAQANANIDLTQSLSSTIDGVPVPDLFSFRAESPAGGFTLQIPPGSMLTDFGYTAGDRNPAVSDGYWLMLEPLSYGEHTINFSGVVGDGQDVFFNLDMTYRLTVVPEPSSLICCGLLIGLVFGGYRIRRWRS